jgi:murein DD-endopeptidase MepM/ murein hydrolase activator NlpD
MLMFLKGLVSLFIHFLKESLSVKRVLIAFFLIASGMGMAQIRERYLSSVEEERVKQENRLLREENQLYQERFNELKKRVNTVEDLSKELFRVASVTTPEVETIGSENMENAIGGPDARVEKELVSELTLSTTRLEKEFRSLKLNLERKQLEEASVPSGLPIDGLLTDRFGNRRNPFGDGYEYHSGIDIAAGFGSPVRATADGFVIYAAAHSGYGNVVIIDHGNSITTRYGHLSSINAKFGEWVSRGDVVGRAGSTGRSTGPHVHYEIRRDNIPLNPLNYKNQASR